MSYEGDAVEIVASGDLAFHVQLVYHVDLFFFSGELLCIVIFSPSCLLLLGFHEAESTKLQRCKDKEPHQNNFMNVISCLN